jgi:hypothetical protein
MVDSFIKVARTLDELDIPVLYNEMVDIVLALSIDLPLSKKSSRSVDKQVDIICKGSDLFRQIYLNQVSQNVKY